MEVPGGTGVVTPPGGAAGPDGRLSGGELASLQLLALGYSLEQIGRLRAMELVDVLWDLQRALTLLNAATVAEAVATARRRGMIVPAGSTTPRPPS